MIFTDARTGAVLLTVLTFSFGATATVAQTAPPSLPTQDAASTASEDEATEVDEIVVTGVRRAPVGSVVGDIAPEITLSPREIQSYGVSSIEDLIAELAPQTSSGRGRARGGDAPVVLLNGRRISGFGEIRAIPVEAILRTEILPEEVALKYGYSANQRVINVVLRRFFRASTGEGQISAPTEGGQVSGQAQASYTRIIRDDRMNFDLRYNRSSELLESDRDLISAAAGRPFDLLGNVTSPTQGAEIDPALSAISGQAAVIAGVPGFAGARPLTLEDFAATAGAPNVTDVRRFRTLSPATESLRANGVISRPLPFGFNGALNVTVAANSRDSLLGLSGYSVVAPAGAAGSPFTVPVAVNRYASVFGPLTQSQDVWTARLASTANRDIGRFRLNLTAAYDHSDTRTQTDVGVDASSLQAQAAAGQVDAFAPVAAGVLGRLAATEAREADDTFTARALANGPVFKLPAGDVTAALGVGDTQNQLDSRSSRAGVEQAISLARNTLNGQLNLDVPIASRRSHVLDRWLGDPVAQLQCGGRSGVRFRPSENAGLWREMDPAEGAQPARLAHARPERAQPDAAGRRDGDDTRLARVRLRHGREAATWSW